MYSWSREDDGVSRGAWNSNDAAYTPAGADGSLHSARFHTYDFMSGYLSSFSLNVDFSSLAGNKTLSFYYINPGGTDTLKVYLSTNGGTSFGITVEGSPNPKKDNALDYSENYEFNLHETYSERTTVITRFKFKPSDRKLYEYDAAEDKLNPIDFNKKLLTKFDGNCK